MKNSRIYILGLIILVLGSCSNKKQTCQLIGDLKNAEKVDYLYLIDINKDVFVDSIPVTSGKFDYKFELLTPSLFRIHNKRNKYFFRDLKFIWLEPGTIKLIGDCNFLNNITVFGSEAHNEYLNYNSLRDSCKKEIGLLKEKSLYTKNLVEKNNIKECIDSLMQDRAQKLIGLIKENNKSYVTLWIVRDQSYFGEIDLKKCLTKNQVREVLNLLPDNLRQTEQGKQIKKYIDSPEPPKFGDIAPNIIQCTPEGDTIKLTDFREKYVLLDFWSSSCGPCRADFKWLRKIYRELNKKGLEIIGISGDIKRSNWVEAIKQDSIPWPNVSDLQGWQNEVFLQYCIEYTPTLYLVDPNGILIKEFTSESQTSYELKKLFEDKNGL